MNLAEYLLAKQTELATKGRIVLKLRVRPGAKEEGWLALLEDTAQLRLAVKAMPVKGRANQAVINFLAAYFGVAAGRVTIKQGLTQPHKLVEIKIA